jgi:alpha-L-arabinofuranosidase
MKAKDSSIFTIVYINIWSGADTHFDEIMNIVGGKADIYGYHPMIGTPKDNIVNDEQAYLSFMSTTYNSKIQEWWEKLLKNYPESKLASTEWWTSLQAQNPDWLLDTNIRNYTLEAALWSGLQYLTYMKNPQIMALGAKTLGIGMFKREINSQGKKVIYATPALPALALVSQKRGDFIVANSVECETYYRHESPHWANETKYLDVTTSITDDTLFISVINRHPQNSIETSISIDNYPTSPNGKIYEFTSEHYLDFASPDEPNKIQTIEKNLDLNILKNGDSINDFTYSFPKHSITVLAIPGNFSSIPTYPSEEFLIYPNPTKNLLNIVFNSDKKIQNITIYNIIGQIVYSNQLNFFTNQVNIENLNLPIGSYQLIIETPNNVYNRNLIIK